MRRLVSSALVLAVAAAVPAQARIVGTQLPVPPPRGDPFVGHSRLPAPSVGRELRSIRGDIKRARESGDLTAREARLLRRETRLIARLAERYESGGLSVSERGELQTRTQALQDAVLSR